MRSLLFGALLAVVVAAPAAASQATPVAPSTPAVPDVPAPTSRPARPAAAHPVPAVPLTHDVVAVTEAMAGVSEALHIAHDAVLATHGVLEGELHLAMESSLHATEAVRSVDAASLVSVAPVARAAVATRPPQGWSPSDPADSLYRAARETLNRSEYRRAAQLFRQVRERHPRSEYVSEAAYWEAFALYRIGSTDDLRNALRILDQQGTYARKQTQASADALSARVLGALARRGDSDAQRRVATAAQSGTAACDEEDLMVRVEALNALSQLDQAAAMPLLRRVLERRDDCSKSLRRSAVTLAARRGGAEALPLLTEVATADPSTDVRSVAVSSIARMETDDAAGALEGMLRASDPEVRRIAARALARRTDARSRRALRSYLETPQVSESHKAEAILNFHKETATPDDIAYLRTLYGRTDSDRIRSAIITVLPRLAPDETRQWLLSIARDANQPTSSRSAAISAVSRDPAVPVVELGRMYDAANERRIREYVVSALGRREEPEATEKLIEIARNGTDPVVRSSAINQLSRRKDPRLQGILQELIDR